MNLLFAEGAAAEIKRLADVRVALLTDDIEHVDLRHQRLSVQLT